MEAGFSFSAARVKQGSFQWSQVYFLPRAKSGSAGTNGMQISHAALPL